MRFPNRRALTRWTAMPAVDNARLAEYIDSLPSRVDAVVDASDESDWAEVRRLCTLLARSCNAVGCTELSTSARRVCDALDQPHTASDLRRRILHLVADCGAIRRPDSRANQTSSLAL